MQRTTIKYVAVYGSNPEFLSMCKWADTQLRLSLIYIKQWYETYRKYGGENTVTIFFKNIKSKLLNSDKTSPLHLKRFECTLKDAYDIYNKINKHGMKNVFIKALCEEPPKNLFTEVWLPQNICVTAMFLHYSNELLSSNGRKYIKCIEQEIMNDINKDIIDDRKNIDETTGDIY